MLFDPGAGVGVIRIEDFLHIQECPAEDYPTCDGLGELANEISSGFYNPDTQYNYAFCTSGTCYGAQLWTEANMPNPDETLGPLINTEHTSPATDANLVGLRTHAAIKGDPAPDHNIYLRRADYRGNTNFSNDFWVVSGDPMLADFASGIFGYPSPSSDLDGDRDVDVADFLTWSNCYNGPLNPPSPICANDDADLDQDGDVDNTDFLTLSRTAGMDHSSDHCPTASHRI